MENLKTSDSSHRSVTQSLPLISRIARQLVFQQFARLGHGRLVVRETGFEDRVFGDGDRRYPEARLDVHNHGTWRDMVTGGSIGAAEAFVAGDWSSPGGPSDDWASPGNQSTDEDRWYQPPPK